MIQLIALTVATVAGFLPHVLFAGLLGRPLGVFADFLLGSIAGGVAYVVAIYRLKKMRGDL